jgi:hypothetical protein
MLATRGGGKTKKNGSGSRRRIRRDYKGGCGSMLPLSPFALTEGVNTLGTSSGAGAANYTADPAKMGFSQQVGGMGYGFASGAADVPSFAGSYFPVSTVNTAGAPDNNARGGNNFSQGGGAKRRRATKKRSGNKKKRTMKKWRQRGCSKKRGGSKCKK